jgi:hypothetical protein
MQKNLGVVVVVIVVADVVLIMLLLYFQWYSTQCTSKTSLKIALEEADDNYHSC